METVLLGVRIISALSSTDMIFSTLTKSTKNVGLLINCINKYDNKHVINELYKLDIENSIKNIQMFLRDIDIENEDLILKCANDLQETINKIYIEIDKIYNKIRYNNSLWILKSVRSSDCSDSLDRLKAQKIVLNDQLNIILNFSKIYNIKIKKKEIENVDIKVTENSNKKEIENQETEQYAVLT